MNGSNRCSRAIVAAFALGGSQLALADGLVELVSRGAFPAQMPSSGTSSSPAISADGRYIVFRSDATTFGTTDTNGVGDIYLYDRTTFLFSLLSRRGTTQADGASGSPAISADGGRVAFASAATNLTAGPDTNGFSDIFVLERATGAMRRLVPAAGEPDAYSTGPVQISSDGRYVAFLSAATNWLATPDTDAADDIFVYDLDTNTVEKANLGTTGLRAEASFYFGGNSLFALSGGGRCVAFQSRESLVPADTNGLVDIYLRDLVAGTTELVSASASGVVGNGDSYSPWPSPDCSRVAFATLAGNLHADTTVNFASAALEKTRIGGAVARIWPALADPAAGQEVAYVGGSPDGAHLALYVHPTGDPLATVLTPQAPSRTIAVWRRSDGVVTLSPSAVTGDGTLAIQNGGAFVAYETARPIVTSDRNAYEDIALFDVAGLARVAVTIPPSPVIATTGNGASGIAERTSPLMGGQFRQQYVSDDGLLVGYSSVANNLITSDDNGFEDVFVADRRTGTNQRITRGVGGAEANGDSGLTDMTGDGRFLVIESCANNLVAGDTNGVCDLFVTDRTVSPIVFERVNVASDGTAANADAIPSLGGHWGSISADGRYVAFISSATNLVPGDTNGLDDLFLRDRIAGTTTLLTRGVGGVPANGFVKAQPRISADGRYVSFRSNASNLVAGIGGSRIWVVDTTTFAYEVASVTSDEVLVVPGASRSFISSDGRYVGFVADDDAPPGNLVVPGDTDGQPDVFVRDRLLGKTTLASLQPDGTSWDVSTFIGGLSSRGLVLPFIVDEGMSFGGAAYSYDISTGRVDRIFAAPPGFSQALRPAASSNGRFVAVAHNGVLTASDQNGAIYDIYLASDYITGISGGAEGAAPELALAGSAMANAEMGESVAQSEQYVVAGAPGANEVYIYERPPGATGTTMMRGIATAKSAKDFTLVATIAAPGGGAIGDKWGASVAITPDGSTLVIGAPGVNEGQVAVFQRPAGGWASSSSPAQTINAMVSGGMVPDEFGTSVDIAVDGRIVVGAPLTDVLGAPDAGMVAVYRPETGGLYSSTPTQQFTAPAAQAGAGFGAAVDVTASAIAVGAPLENDGPNVDEGAVYTYASAGTNEPFSASATIRPPDGGDSFDKWGSDVGLGTNTLVVGSPGADTAAGTDTGAGYVYQSPNDVFGTATPSEMMPPNPVPGESVGMSVEVAGDYVVIGAPLSDRLNVVDTGTAFVFERPELGWATRQQHIADIELRASESQAEQEFGSAVGVTRQGLVIGVPLRNVGTREDQGEADTFVFDRIIRAGFE
ncbi:MAG TPA: hypothetical protein VFO79_09850 [Xanthomonadales bacterium]|nr:hypothetical protein [Xanthomonadales bacterium]